jgi:hypothetical protein
MENDEVAKADQAAVDAQADGYYGEDDMDMEDLDLSFLDEEEDDKDETAKKA